MGMAAGLVIAGGASSRFGADKALALLRGRPLLGWSLAALDVVCAEVAVSARLGGPLWTTAVSSGRRAVADDPAHPHGPLAGLVAGMAWARESGRATLLSLPVDMPLITPDILRRLLEAASGSPAAFAISPGGPHPLCAAWNTDLAAPLRARLDAGDHPSVRGWLREVGAAEVAFDDDAPFRNVNTRPDLADLESRLAGAQGSDA